MKKETYTKTVESKTCEKKTCREKTNWVLSVTLPPEEGETEDQVVKGYVCPYHCFHRGEE